MDRDKDRDRVSFSGRVEVGFRIGIGNTTLLKYLQA